MKPWAKAKAGRRVLSPDERWAAELAERILGDCHPWQHDAATDPGRRISMLVGRGGTKTTTMRVRALLKLTRIRRASVLYLATTRGQAEELNWFKLKDAVENYGLSSEFQFTESKLRATCTRTGSIYTLAGAEDDRDIERYRGQPFDEVQIDEAGSHDPERLARLIYRVIAPRLGERDGCIVLGGTPSHILRGPFYDATRLGSPLHRPYARRTEPEFAGWKSWSSHAWTLRDVVGLPDAHRFPALVKNWAEALVEKEANKWSDDHPVWMREWLGLWAADDTENVFRYRPHLADGSPWNQWDPERVGPMKFAKLPDGVTDWLHVVSLDLGSADPLACNVFAFSPTDAQRRIYHRFSFEKTGMGIKQIAQLLLGDDIRHEKPGGVIGAIGEWPAAMVIDVKQLGGQISAELGAVYGLQIKPAEQKSKYAGIEITNGDLIDGRLFILKGSPLEQQLQQLQWAVDQYGHVKENKAQANHSTDTLVYARREIATMLAAGTGAAPPPPRQAQPLDPDELESETSADDNFGELLADPTFADPWDDE